MNVAKFTINKWCFNRNGKDYRNIVKVVLCSSGNVVNYLTAYYEILTIFFRRPLSSGRFKNSFVAVMGVVYAHDWGTL